VNTNTEGQTVLLSIKQAAERLCICRRTLEREIQRGRFPRPVKIGSASRWPASDLNAYLELLNSERGRASSS